MSFSQYKNTVKIAKGFFFNFGILYFKVFCTEKTLNNEKDHSFIHHNFWNTHKKKEFTQGIFLKLGNAGSESFKTLKKNQPNKSSDVSS